MKTQLSERTLKKMKNLWKKDVEMDKIAHALNCAGMGTVTGKKWTGANVSKTIIANFKLRRNSEFTKGATAKPAGKQPKESLAQQSFDLDDSDRRVIPVAILVHKLFYDKPLTRDERFAVMRSIQRTNQTSIQVSF